MTMSPRGRKLALTAHVVSTVGWLGAIAAFLALSVVGLTSQDAETVRGVYLVMEPLAWLVLVPLAFASLLTGLVQSLGSAWGLVRHYWVLFKLLITVVATIVLLVYMQTLSSLAGRAADPSADLGLVRNASPTIHATLALLLLFAATVLAVYKPRGLTPYGWRKQTKPRMVSSSSRWPNAPLNGSTAWYSSHRRSFATPPGHASASGAATGCRCRPSRIPSRLRAHAPRTPAIDRAHDLAVVRGDEQLVAHAAVERGRLGLDRTA